MVLNKLKNFLLSLQSKQQGEDIYDLPLQIGPKKGLEYLSLLQEKDLKPSYLHILPSKSLPLIEHGCRGVEVDVTILLLYKDVKCKLD